MQELPWEKTANGKSMRRKMARTGIKHGGFILKDLAFSKMSDVNIISADFQGAPLVFTLLLGILLDSGTTAEFMGVYQQSEPVDEEDIIQALPTFCFRRSRWEKVRDDRQFRQAASKKGYVEGEGQIDSQLVFVTKDVYPDITELVRKLQILVYQGIKLLPSSRNAPAWQEIRMQLKDEAVVFALTYGLFTYSNEDLEKLVASLEKSFAQVDFAGGVLPDNDCFVSYSLSIQERINTFAE